LRRTGGYKQLYHFIFNSAGAANGYDSYGHYLRAVLTPNSCTHYNEPAGCVSRFGPAAPITKAAKIGIEAKKSLRRALQSLLGERSVAPAPEGPASGETTTSTSTTTSTTTTPTTPTTTTPTTTTSPGTAVDAGGAAAAPVDESEGSGKRGRVRSGDIRILMKLFLGGGS
jgi:hypothetical protein